MNMYIFLFTDKKHVCIMYINQFVSQKKLYQLCTIYIYIYIQICIYMHIYIYICIHKYMHIHLAATLTESCATWHMTSPSPSSRQPNAQNRPKHCAPSAVPHGHRQPRHASPVGIGRHSYGGGSHWNPIYLADYSHYSHHIL